MPDEDPTAEDGVSASATGALDVDMATVTDTTPTADAASDPASTWPDGAAVAAAVSARVSARPGAGHDVVVGRDIQGPTSQNDGADGDDVQHPGGHRGEKISLPTSSGSRGGQKQQQRNQKKNAARRARKASLPSPDA